MPIRRQANGNLLVQFQYLGKRVHRSAGIRSIGEAKAFEEEFIAEIRAALVFPSTNLFAADNALACLNEAER